MSLRKESRQTNGVDIAALHETYEALIESLESDFKGNLDLRGFLDLGKNVEKGYQKIEATFRVKTDASNEEISALYQFSPVYSMVSKSVPIEVKIVKT